MTTRIDIMGSHESLLVIESRHEVKEKIQATSSGWIEVTESPKRNPGEARTVDLAIDKILTIRESLKARQSHHTVVPAVIGDRAAAGVEPEPETV